MRTVALLARTAADEMADAIRAGEPFKISTGNLTGDPVRPGVPGELDRLGEALLPTAVMETVYRADYVIRSYATPIAWRVEGEWVIPWHGYSATTARHQGRVRGVPRALGEPTRDMPHRYRVGLRHDGGWTAVYVTAHDEVSARLAACRAEAAPDRAITSVRWAD